MSLWISNVAPGTTDDELRQFLHKYGPDLEVTSIQHVDGDGSRPAVVLSFGPADFGTVEKLATRLNGMYWKGRALLASTTNRL